MVLNFKVTVSWDVIPRSMADKYRCFKGNWCFHYQGRRNHFISTEPSSRFSHESAGVRLL